MRGLVSGAGVARSGEDEACCQFGQSYQDSLSTEASWDDAADLALAGSFLLGQRWGVAVTFPASLLELRSCLSESLQVSGSFQSRVVAHLVPRDPLAGFTVTNHGLFLMCLEETLLAVITPRGSEPTGGDG